LKPTQLVQPIPGPGLLEQSNEHTRFLKEKNLNQANC